MVDDTASASRTRAGAIEYYSPLSFCCSYFDKCIFSHSFAISIHCDNGALRGYVDLCCCFTIKYSLISIDRSCREVYDVFAWFGEGMVDHWSDS